MTELIRRLSPERFRVYAVCFRRVGAWLPKVEAAAEEVAEFRIGSFKSPAAFGVMRDLVRWMRERRIAVVQASDRYSNIFALPAAALARVPVRVGGRREIAPPGQTRAHAVALRYAYRTAHRVVANCTAAAERLVEEGVPVSRVANIPNGIDLASYLAPAPRARRRIVATVANLREGKGHDVLLRAAALLLPRVPDIRFRFIGGGPMDVPLRTLAAELRVAHAVEFLGHCDNVPDRIADSDLYAFPSWSEAFPNGLIEGMAAGLPVVTGAVGGIAEVIDDEQNGLLVPPRDPQALASALLRLVEDAPLADRLAAAARQTVATRYSFDRMVADFEQLYVTELAQRTALVPAPLRAA